MSKFHQMTSSYDPLVKFTQKSLDGLTFAAPNKLMLYASMSHEFSNPKIVLLTHMGKARDSPRYVLDII